MADDLDQKFLDLLRLRSSEADQEHSLDVIRTWLRRERERIEDDKMRCTVCGWVVDPSLGVEFPKKEATDG